MFFELSQEIGNRAHIVQLHWNERVLRHTSQTEFRALVPILTLKDMNGKSLPNPFHSLNRDSGMTSTQYTVKQHSHLSIFFGKNRHFN